MTGTKEYELYNSAKSRAKRLGLEFDLAVEDVVIPDVCPMLGIPIVSGVRVKQAASPTLDRIDNARGYVRGNVIVVSDMANRAKGNATSEDIRKVGLWMESLGL